METNEIMTFGKFKGKKFIDTPKWYQIWLSKQDWFNSSKQSNESYALVENGMIHTEDLALEDANEMKKRHQNFFPNCTWEVLPMNAIIGMIKQKVY